MDISDWRKKIDEIDATVLKLMNLRADMAIEIGKLKSREGIGLRVPAREREIVERMQQANPGPLDAESIEKIYATIVNECIRAQERSRMDGSGRLPSDAAPKKAATVARPAKSSGAISLNSRKPKKSKR